MAEQMIGPRILRDNDAALEPGDLFIVVNDPDEPIDMRAGIKGFGRYWHCDHAFNRKAQVWTGKRGLLAGLAIDPQRRTIYASSHQNSHIMAFDVDGHEVEMHHPPARRYGNLVLDGPGRVIVGIHTVHGAPPADDDHGDGKLIRFDPVGGAFEFFDVDIDGGRNNRHCISGLALTPADDQIVFYMSEAGHRLSRYDMRERRQLPDFHIFTDGDHRTYGLDILATGEVVMATGIGAVRMDPAGRIIRHYDVPAMRGWTRARLAPDGRHFYLGNFVEGLLQRRDVETGEIVAQLDIGRKGALTAVAEYRPAS